jgi:hypothetical protein
MEKKISQAESNLQIKLDWIGRLDSRISFVAGISIAMLGVLATASSALESETFFICLMLSFASVALLLTLLLIYLCIYPKTESNNKSLIYFGTISEMKYEEFRNSFTSRTDDEYLNDLLCQIHINAIIISKKFIYLKASLILVLASVIPWVIIIYQSKIFLK